MSWIAPDGADGVLEPRCGLAACASGSVSHCDKDANGLNAQWVPLWEAPPCGTIHFKGCSRPGLPQTEPCLPCDIFHIRPCVTGTQVKRAMAECQRRYFCRVWNLLFAYLFPGEHSADSKNPTNQPKLQKRLADDGPAHPNRPPKKPSRTSARRSAAPLLSNMLLTQGPSLKGRLFQLPYLPHADSPQRPRNLPSPLLPKTAKRTGRGMVEIRWGIWDPPAVKSTSDLILSKGGA